MSGLKITVAELKAIAATFDRVAIPNAILVTDEEWERIKNTIQLLENITTEVFSAPNFGNATDAFIVDELGEIGPIVKGVTKYEKMLKEVAKSRKPEDKNSLEGETYIMFFEDKVRTGFGADLLREHVDSVSLAKCLTSTEYVETRTKKK